MGIEVHFGRKKRILEMNGGDNCTTNVNVLNATKLCI